MAQAVLDLLVPHAAEAALLHLRGASDALPLHAASADADLLRAIREAPPPRLDDASGLAPLVREGKPALLAPGVLLPLHVLVAPLPRQEGALVLAWRHAPPDEADAALAQELARRLGDALERESLRARLREAQERFGRVSAATLDVLWEWDAATDRVWRSAAFSPEEAGEAGIEAWLDRIHPEDRARVEAGLRGALAGDAREWQAEYRFRVGDSWRRVQDRARVERDASGGAVRVVGAMQDVTRWREAEDAALLQKVLLESQNEAALDGIFFQGVDGRTVFYNRRLLEMWGIDESVPSGESVEERASKVLHKFADPQAFLEKVMALERDRDATLREDIRLVDGRIFDCYAAPVRTREGAYAGRVWFYRDVTARRRLEEDLANARRHLAHSEKLAALGSLVSGVAHEIRTPLAYVSNEAHLLARGVERVAQGAAGAEDLERLRRSCAAITEGVERMNRLVSDLRRFSRLEAGSRTLVPLDEVVLGATDLFAATHRGRAVLDVRLESGARVLADRIQVQQVVLNLLENAADASPTGATIRVLTRAAQGAALLLVEDDGPGIPQEVQARMWEPFFTTKPEGTGLGLSIVRRIVETHQGSLQCVSGTGHGARFEVALPLAP